MITRHQSKAARALLDLKQAEIAKLAEVSISMMRDFETGKRHPHPANLESIQKAFEDAGVQFTAPDDVGLGVRLAPRQKTIQFNIRVDQAFLDTVDKWRRNQPNIPPRAEAVRSLVKLGAELEFNEQQEEDA